MKGAETKLAAALPAGRVRREGLVNGRWPSDRSAGLEFRRAPHLLLHWQENQLVLHNYAVRRTLPAHALVIDVLGQFDAWRRLGQYLDTVPAAARDSVRRLVHELHRQRLLWRRDEPLSTEERAMDAWDQWNPSAGFFHSASKDVNFIDMDMHARPAGRAGDHVAHACRR